MKNKNILPKEKVEQYKKKRISLEKKYTKLALKTGGKLTVLPSGRILSCSPTAYHYTGGKGTSSYADDNTFYSCSNVMHNKSASKRYFVEKKINKILGKGLVFQLKDEYKPLKFEDFNKKLQKKGKKRISKQKFNEIKNLFRKFEELSKDEHYKLNNAEKRIAKKNGLQ